MAKHFGDRGSSEYLVSVVRRDDAATAVYNSGDATVDGASADVTTGLFDLRMDELNRLAPLSDRLPAGALAASSPASGWRSRSCGAPTVRGQTRADGRRTGTTCRARGRCGCGIAADRSMRSSRGRAGATWRSASACSGLLAASVVLIILAAQRQQRLARQQMEFVAAVSHELRTPLAVICSAGREPRRRRRRRRSRR